MFTWTPNFDLVSDTHSRIASQDLQVDIALFHSTRLFFISGSLVLGSSLQMFLRKRGNSEHNQAMKSLRNLQRQTVCLSFHPPLNLVRKLFKDICISQLLSR